MVIPKKKDASHVMKQKLLKHITSIAQAIGFKAVISKFG
jgi:hypothetical protein